MEHRPSIGRRYFTTALGLKNASRSALIVSACVVGMPCGEFLYVLSVPFLRSFADNGPESVLWSPILFRFALHCWRFWIFDFHPMR